MASPKDKLTTKYVLKRPLPKIKVVSVQYEDVHIKSPWNRLHPRKPKGDL